MNLSDFVKECVKYADGFELREKDYGFLREPDGDCFFELKDLENHIDDLTFWKITYPLLIQLTIDGINKKCEGDSAFFITQSRDNISVNRINRAYHHRIWIDSSVSTIEAKRIVLEYVFERKAIDANN